MLLQNIKIRLWQLFHKKQITVSEYDFEDDISKSFEKFVEAYEKYYQVASHFFSTSIEEDENSLRKSAEDTLLAYKTVELFTLFERINFFHKATDKITKSLDELAELMFWMDKHDKKTISDIEKYRAEYGDTITSLFFLHVPLENRFLNLVYVYTVGLSIVLTSYFHYLVENLFSDISLPSAIENFRKRHKLSKLWLVLPFVGLALTILGFIPLISIATGIIGLIMFFLENYILAGKELINLKRCQILRQRL